MKRTLLSKIMLLLCALIAGSSSVWATDQTITLTYSSLGLETSYKKKTATVSDFEFTVDQGYKGSGNVIQMNSSRGSGILYNTTAIPGLKSIKVNVSSGSNTYTITTGTSEKPTANSQTGTTGGTYNASSGDTFFQLKVSGGYSYFSSIEITYTPSGGDVSEPSISLSSNTIEATDAAKEGTINVTYNNLTDYASDVIFVGSDGTTPAEYDWLDAEINATDNTKLDYAIGANTGAARTAYMRVYVVDNSLGELYSPVITITQAANNNIAPAWSTLPTPNVNVSQQYQLDLTGYVTGIPAPTITLKSSTADANDYTFDNGKLTFNTANAGEYDFIFTATNSEGSVDATLTVTVCCVPTISVPQTSYSTKLGDEDVEFTVTATGTPTPTLAFSDTNANSNDYGFDPNDGFFTFTPSATGTFTFTFTATNDVGSDSKTVTVNVKSIASILVADANIAYGSTYTVDDTYIEGGEITVTSGNTSVATVNGLVITPVAVGKTTITVATAENATYAAGSETFELTVTAPEGKSVMAGAENTTNVTLNKYGYATFCSVNPMDFTSTTGYTAWRISGIEGGTITFEKITGTIKGGQGVLLYNKDADGVNTSNVTITFADGTTVFTTSENKLVGTTAPTYVEANEYYGLKGNKFVKVSPAGTVPAGKALLPSSAINSSASEFSIIFEDGTTGIGAMLNNKEQIINNVYDLQGRKVAQPSKGLYIVNGKKVIVK